MGISKLMNIQICAETEDKQMTVKARTVEYSRREQLSSFLSVYHLWIISTFFRISVAVSKGLVLMMSRNPPEIQSTKPSDHKFVSVCHTIAEQITV